MIDERVEKYMPPIMAAIKRHIKDHDAFTDIYNRAYEAIMISMDENDTALRSENERLKEALEWYADPENYKAYYQHNAGVMIEKGERARIALSGGKDGE